MKEQYRLNLSAGYGIGIDSSIDGEKWSQVIYFNIGARGGTAKLAVKLVTLLNMYDSIVEVECPSGVGCPEDIGGEIPKQKCPICWDRFFDKKVDELSR